MELVDKEEDLLVAILSEVMKLDRHMFAHICGHGQMDRLNVFILKNIFVVHQKRLGMVEEDSYDGWEEEQRSKGVG